MIENNVIQEGTYQNKELSFIHPVLKEKFIDSLHDINDKLKEVKPITLIEDNIVEQDEELEDEDEDFNSTNSYKELDNSNGND